MRKAFMIPAALAALMLGASPLRAEGKAPTDPLRDAYAAAKSRLVKDRSAYKSVYRARLAACKTPGGECDAAKAKEKPLSEAVSADVREMQKACSALEAAGQKNPCNRRRKSPKKP